jgi:hypothetical protein
VDALTPVCLIVEHLRLIALPGACQSFSVCCVGVISECSENLSTALTQSPNHNENLRPCTSPSPWKGNTAPSQKPTIYAEIKQACLLPS